MLALAATTIGVGAYAATPVAEWDSDFNDLDEFTGYELVDWNETHGEGNSSVTIDRANQGLMFNADSGMPGMTILVRYSGLQADSSNKKVLFTSCVNDNHEGYRTGVRLGTDGKINGMWGNADYGTAGGSVPESGVMAFVYSTAGTFLYAAEKGTEALQQVWGNGNLKSSNDTAIYGGAVGGFCDGSSIGGFAAATDMTIEAVAVFDSVVPLAELQDYIWPTEEDDLSEVARTVAADATANWTDAAWTIDETADQSFTPDADTLYNVTVTVGGDCTIVMPESIGSFDRRNIKFVLDSGVQSATVTLKYTGTLPESGSVALNPFGTATVVPADGVTLAPEYNGDTSGYVTSTSGLTVTIIKGANFNGTITADTNWSDIKPDGWANAMAGNEPSIAINYEGTEPVTLTFDEAVQAGSLTLVGNIVVEATGTAEFGTVNAGTGSVVEMANVTIATQTGAGIYRYRSDYPSAVQNNSLTYEYIGADTAADAPTVALGSMRGTVRTSGFINITDYYPLFENCKLDVVSGTTTLTAGGQGICGYITIREGATLVNTATDSLAYSSYSSTIDIYGTLDMGTSRWTVWSGATFNFRGGEMVGVGQDNNGALDFMGTCNVYAYADSTISGNVKFRNALSNVTVAEGVTLTISGETKPGYNGGGITKKGAGTLKFTSDPYVPGGIVVEAGTLAFDTESDVDPVVTYTAAVLKDANMDYATASNWNGTVVISAVEAGTTATQVALNKTGNENSYLTLNGVSGNAWCAGSDYTVQPAMTLAGDVNFENGSSGKTVTFRKIAAGTGNLSLKSWSSCTGITYGFTTLDADNYTGTIQLDGSVLTFNVGDILKADAGIGDLVLPLTVANGATVNLANATLNGAVAEFEVKEDGIYVAGSEAMIGDTEYETLAEAVAAAEDDDEIVLLKNIVLAEEVTVENGITMSANKAVTISGSGMKLNIASGTTLTLEGSITVSCQIGFKGAGATLVKASDVTVGVTRPYTGVSGVVNTVEDDPEVGYISYTLTQMTTVAVTANQSVVDGVVAGPYAPGTVLEFTVTPNEGYVVDSVMVGNEEIVAVDGTYSVTVGDTPMQIVVNTSEAGGGAYAITENDSLGEGGTLVVGTATTIKIGNYDVTDGFAIDNGTATLQAPELAAAPTIDGNVVTLSTADLVQGLYYGVGASATLEGLTRPAELTQYDGTNIGACLEAPKPDGTSGFFSLYVDIKK